MCGLYPAAYVLVSYSFGASVSLLACLGSFALGLVVLFVLESFSIEVVYSLDVRKEDLRMKFGDAFEDLSSESTREKFSDIGNYESTKKELQDAIIFPIEQKGVSRAYNVKPVRGVLLFGPPGTGKTMIMKALANEIHVGFYLIKASNLVSSAPGETERRLANVFNIARKNQPCVLFIDELDSIARSQAAVRGRRVKEGHADPATHGDGRIQEGRQDNSRGRDQRASDARLGHNRGPAGSTRIIYMPLPDYTGRKAIFKMYLSKLPVSAKIKLDEIAKAQRAVLWGRHQERVRKHSARRSPRRL